jgi:hypothetical protein
MTQDEIIEMAIQARLAFDSEEYPEIWQTYMNVGKQEIEAFAKLVAAKEREEANARANASWELMCKKMGAFEREACAKVCETLWNTPTNGMATEEEAYGDECAAAIRARGQA